MIVSFPATISTPAQHTANLAASLAPFDWVLLALAAWSVVRGLLHGAIQELFALAGAAAALLLAEWNYAPIALWLASEGLAHGLVTNVVAFLLVALAVFACAMLLGRLVRMAAHLIGLGLVDRLAGGLLGLARAAVLGILLLTALSAFLPPQPWLLRSRLAPPLARLARSLAPLAPPHLAERINDGVRDLLRWQAAQDHELRVGSDPLPR